MANEQKEDDVYKIVVMGAGGVGKSCITLQMVYKDYKDKWDPTIEDRYKCDHVVDNENASMEILDTAGQDEFKSIRDIYYRTGDGFILVYSITDTNSLDDIEECVEGIMQTTVSELEQRTLTF